MAASRLTSGTRPTGILPDSAGRVAFVMAIAVLSALATGLAVYREPRQPVGTFVISSTAWHLDWIYGPNYTVSLLPNLTQWFGDCSNVSGSYVPGSTVHCWFNVLFWANQRHTWAACEWVVASSPFDHVRLTGAVTWPLDTSTGYLQSIAIGIPNESGSYRFNATIYVGS